MSNNSWATTVAATDNRSDFPAVYNADQAASRFRTSLHTSADVTLAKDADTVLCDATSAALSVTLPSSPSDGDTYVVKKTDASTNAVTVDGNSANIDGASTYSLSAQYDIVTVQFDATDGAWYIIGK